MEMVFGFSHLSSFLSPFHVFIFSLRKKKEHRNMPCARTSLVRGFWPCIVFGGLFLSIWRIYFLHFRSIKLSLIEWYLICFKFFVVVDVVVVVACQRSIYNTICQFCFHVLAKKSECVCVRFLFDCECQFGNKIISTEQRSS